MSLYLCLPPCCLCAHLELYSLIFTLFCYPPTFTPLFHSILLSSLFLSSLFTSLSILLFISLSLSLFISLSHILNLSVCRSPHSLSQYHPFSLYCAFWTLRVEQPSWQLMLQPSRTNGLEKVRRTPKLSSPLPGNIEIFIAKFDFLIYFWLFHSLFFECALIHDMMSSYLVSYDMIWYDMIWYDIT